jgi:hypothetical protein
MFTPSHARSGEPVHVRSGVSKGRDALFTYFCDYWITKFLTGLWPA